MLKLTILTALLAFSKGHDERLKDEDGNYIGRGCGTEEYMEAQLAADPVWAKSLDDFETVWQQRQSDIISGKVKSEPMRIHIPIVFHMLGNNIQDFAHEQAIISQLQTLNDDFAGTNSDYTSGVPPEFQPLRAGNTLITYSIQDTLWRQTTESFSSNNNIKFTSSGGSDVVNPQSNLNFWAGTLSGGLLGYAQFPGGNDATDGVVNGIGTLSPAVGNPPYNLGRTATHEIGHWLNLRHIWGDNSGCTNTETISDFVLDTPPSSSSNFGCPAGTKRCSENTFTQDMYMNYMDYVEDDCMVMFSIGQNERAQASIDQYRGGFRVGKESEADKEYINFLYFNRFEDEQDDENKCIGDHILFYDNNINEDSNSNVYIYGCLMKTNIMTVRHMTDIKFVNDKECGDGYTRSAQDLNEGNDDGPIYLCYSKEDSTADNDNMAILDITFIKNDDTSKLDIDEWEVNKVDNINPNGIKLNFAVKKGEYLPETTMKSASNPIDGGLNEEEQTYVGVGIAVFLIASILIGFVLWKHVCSQKGYKQAMNESLTEQYGATRPTTEMAEVTVE